MYRFVISRLIQLPFALFGVLTIVFFIMTASGDPAVLLVSPDATPDLIDAMRHKMGFDRPLYEQYGSFLWNAIHGDFGISFYEGEPAFDVVLRYLPATLELTMASLAVGTAIALPLGILAARQQGKLIDTCAIMIAVLGQSMPVFWLGILLMLVFSLKLHWLPVGGRGGMIHLILPALTLGWHFNAFMTRLVRSAMLEILDENYIRTARAKGLPEWIVICKHAFKNAQLPVLTVWGLQLGALMTGAVVSETVFSWPGLGRASITAVLGRDYPVILASVFVFAIIFITINLIIDIAYFLIDPRIRDR
jgi:peptide/nickel transport system permease protein